MPQKIKRTVEALEKETSYLKLKYFSMAPFCKQEPKPYTQMSRGSDWLRTVRANSELMESHTSALRLQ